MKQLPDVLRVQPEEGGDGADCDDVLPQLELELLLRDVGQWEGVLLVAAVVLGRSEIAGIVEEETAIAKLADVPVVALAVEGQQNVDDIPARVKPARR
jgi:hypothetical protein